VLAATVVEVLLASPHVAVIGTGVDTDTVVINEELQHARSLDVAVLNPHTLAATVRGVHPTPRAPPASCRSLLCAPCAVLALLQPAGAAFFYALVPWSAVFSRGLLGAGYLAGVMNTDQNRRHVYVVRLVRVDDQADAFINALLVAHRENDQVRRLWVHDFQPLEWEEAQAVHAATFGTSSADATLVPLWMDFLHDRDYIAFSDVIHNGRPEHVFPYSMLQLLVHDSPSSQRSAHLLALADALRSDLQAQRRVHQQQLSPSPKSQHEAHAGHRPSFVAAMQTGVANGVGHAIIYTTLLPSIHDRVLDQRVRSCSGGEAGIDARVKAAWEVAGIATEHLCVAWAVVVKGLVTRRSLLRLLPLNTLP